MKFFHLIFTFNFCYLNRVESVFRRNLQNLIALLAYSGLLYGAFEKSIVSDAFWGFQ